MADRNIILRDGRKYAVPLVDHHSSIYFIQQNTTILLEQYKQSVIHGEMILEGELDIEGNLIIEE